jgi:hypothetical protein
VETPKAKAPEAAPETKPAAVPQAKAPKAKAPKSKAAPVAAVVAPPQFKFEIKVSDPEKIGLWNPFAGLLTLWFYSFAVLRFRHWRLSTFVLPVAASLCADAL